MANALRLIAYNLFSMHRDFENKFIIKMGPENNVWLWLFLKERIVLSQIRVIYV